MKKLFLVMMAAFLIVATNTIATGVPSVNSVMNVQEVWTTSYYFGGQKVIFYMHPVKIRTNKVFAENDMETMDSRDGYFYFLQKRKKVKYTVKEDYSMLGVMDKLQGDVYLNGKNVGHYAFSSQAGYDRIGIMTLNGKKYKMH